MALVKIVENKCGNDVLAWKYPNDELNTLTQLIVKESEEAILLKDGKALDVFTSGRYTLDTPNIPLLNKIINIPFGGKSPFKVEVWYVNTVNILDIIWGTKPRFQIQDPKYDVLIPVRAFGQFAIKVKDSKKMLVKLVGKIERFDIENIKIYFRGLYLTKVKDSISSYIVKKKISVTEINAYLDELSEYITERMDSIFDEFGIKLVNFYVNDISIPEDDNAVKTLKDALAKRAEMNIVGFDYQQERSFNAIDNISNKAAEAGSSNLLNIGLGLAVGTGVGKTIASEFKNISENMNIESKNVKYCSNCGSPIELYNANFCPNCGTKLK